MVFWKYQSPFIVPLLFFLLRFFFFYLTRNFTNQRYITERAPIFRLERIGRAINNNRRKNVTINGGGGEKNLTMLPLGLLPLVITPPPGVSPCLPRDERFIRQESGETAFKGVRISANRVRRIAVITALAVEADITGRADEERLQQFAVGDLINLRR